VCRILRSESDLYIIMLTARSTMDDKLRGFDTGADDYLTKPFSPRELAARIRAVLRRNRPERRGPAALHFDDIHLDLERHEARVGARPLALTPAEFRLLEAFMRAPERVFTREEIIERVLGRDYDGLDRTIDVHVKNLRRKIAAERSRPAPIVTVFGVGYKLTRQERVE
jgi:DNA-binding response OmpR family regulator